MVQINLVIVILQNWSYKKISWHEIKLFYSIYCTDVQQISAEPRCFLQDVIV